jgi:Ca2+-binding EF-hand superfamily protein
MQIHSFSAFFTLGACAVLSGAFSSSAYGQTAKPPEATDLLALEVILSDQNNAQRTLGRHDRNGDERLDAAEMRELGWPEPPAMFDVNKDGRLTVLEIAIQFAYRRKEAGVTRVDQNAAGRFIQRHDKNEDGELDAEEMRSGNWPPDPENFDTDKNGRLTRFEIATRFARNREKRATRGIEPIDHSYAITTMNIYDRSGDRRLDAKELRDARLPKDLTFDEDGDGLVTITEIENILSSDRHRRGVTALDQANARRFMSRCDRNGDDELDANEMREGGWPADPSEFDADKNGRLTVAEIATQFAKSKAERGITDADQQYAGRLLLLYDRNNNNLIEVDEVIQAQRTAAGQQPANTKITPLTILSFVHFDEDRDQRLSKGEVATLLAQQRKEQDDEKKAPSEQGKPARD